MVYDDDKAALDGCMWWPELLEFLDREGEREWQSGFREKQAEENGKNNAGERREMMALQI